MKEPLSIKRKNYVATVANATNNSGLPAFVVVDVLERILSEMKKAADAEIKRDEAMWHKAQQEEHEQKEHQEHSQSSEVTENAESE